MPCRWIRLLPALILVLAAAIGSAQTKSQQGSAQNSTAAPNAAASAEPDNDDSPDIPPIARGRISEGEYLRLRDRQAGLKRGVADLARKPQARSQAIRAMESQERALRQRRMATANAPEIAATALSPLTWTGLGPDPIPNGQTIDTSVAVSGRVTAIAIDPTDSTGNTVYVGTAQGGLYRTLDGGTTWAPLMDSAQSLAIGALALDPRDHTKLFVGTGEGNFSLDSFFGVGLYVITSANTTANVTGPFNEPTSFPAPNTDGFTDVFTGRAITQILVNPVNDNQILVSTSSGFSGASGDIFSTLPTRGVYLSTNALSGNPTFARLTVQTAAGAANRPVTDMVMDPGNPNLVLVNVYGLTGDEGGIWASPNTVWAGTGTWTQAMQTAALVNGKFAFNRSGDPTPATTFLVALDEKASSDPCSGAEGALFKSTNGGASWTELSAARGFCGDQCFYDMAVAVDPTTLNNIYIGGEAGSAIGSCGPGTLGKSTDGGNTFGASQGSLHADAHAIAILPSNPSLIYTGNDGGIFRSDDGGATWTSLNTTGLSATQFESIAVHPTDPNFTIGGTQDNGTPFLQPDGVTWTRADFGDGGFSAIDQNATDSTNVTMYHTYFNVANVQVGVAQVASVADATDGNWTFLGCSGTLSNNGTGCADTVLFYAPLALGPGNPNRVYFGTDRLYRSTDKSATMTVVSQAPLVANVPISAIGISPLSDNVRIVGLGNDATNAVPNGHVFATSSGSNVLRDITGPWIPQYIGRAVIDPNNPNTAYVTLDGYIAASGHVWKTTNLSAMTPTWASASSGIPDVPVNAFAADPLNSNNLYAGTDIGVYNSTDGGNTWNPYGTGLPRVAVFDLAITAKRTVRIATHGRGMWEIAGVAAGLATTTALSLNPSNPGTATDVTLSAVVTHVSGAAVPTGTVAFVDGATVLGSASLDGAATATFSTTALAAGQHSIIAAYGGDSSYAASKGGPAQVNVSLTDFILAIPTASAAVRAGQPATYIINVVPVSGFTGTISFGCTSGLPASTGCSFNPTTVSSSGSTTLTISTAAPTAAFPATGSSASLVTPAGFVGLALFGGLVARKRRRLLRAAFPSLAVLSLSGVLISCGGGGSKPPVTHSQGTPLGTSTVTIAATSGNITHTAVVTLVVQ